MRVEEASGLIRLKRRVGGQRKRLRRLGEARLLGPPCRNRVSAGNCQGRVCDAISHVKISNKHIAPWGKAGEGRTVSTKIMAGWGEAAEGRKALQRTVGFITIP